MSSFAGGSREILLESPGEVRGALAEESRENIPTGVLSYQPEASSAWQPTRCPASTCVLTGGARMPGAEVSVHLPAAGHSPAHLPFLITHMLIIQM